MLRSIRRVAALWVKAQRVSQFFPVRELPQILRRVLDDHSFRKKNVRIEAGEDYHPNMGVSGVGLQRFVVVVDLATNQTKEFLGAWGGASYLNPQQVDLDNTRYPIPPNGAVVYGTEGGRTTAAIRVRPDALVKMLPEPGSQPDLSADELRALYLTARKVPRARATAFAASRLGVYGPENPFIMSLKSKGYLTIDAGGRIGVTREGKNRVEGLLEQDLK